MKAIDLLREIKKNSELLDYGQLIDITLVDEAFPETFLRERMGEASLIEGEIKEGTYLFRYSSFNCDIKDFLARYEPDIILEVNNAQTLPKSSRNMLLWKVE